MMDPVRRLSFAAASLLAAASHLVAQCDSEWSAPNGFSVLGTVNAFADWDPDGAGPLATEVVVAGDFWRAGDASVRNVALYNPQTDGWTSIGDANGAVEDAIALASGDIVIVGNFTEVGGVAAAGIARWDGVWHAVGGGIDVSTNDGDHVASVVQLQNGDVAVAGSFSDASGVAVDDVAIWDGVAWSAVGSGDPGSFLHTIAERPGGGLVVAGFSVREWSGASWQPVPAAPGFTDIYDMQLSQSGDLLVAANSVFGVLWRYSSNTWTSIAPFTDPASAFTELPNGDILASFTGFPGSVARWDGQAWSPYGALPAFNRGHAVHALPGGADDFLIGGLFASIDGQPASNIAKHANGNWATVQAAAFNANITVVAFGDDGAAYCGGSFTEYDGQPLNYIAQWDGAGWQPMGAGIPPGTRNLVVLANGDVVASGTYVPFPWRVAIWNGSFWQVVNGGPSSIADVMPLPDGSFVAGGGAGPLQRWDGVSWQPYANASHLRKLVHLSDGRVLVGVASPSGLPTSSRLAILDGSNWIDVDPQDEILSLHAIDEMSDGDIACAAAWSGAGTRVRRWDGLVWQNLGDAFDGEITHLTALPDGSLLVAGEFEYVGATLCQGIARWDGAAWQSVPGIGSGALGCGGLAASPSGRVLYAPLNPGAAIGGFTEVHFLANDCEPSMAQVGIGCATVGGEQLLTALEWPTIGNRYHARAAGLPDGLAISVIGFQATSLALDSVFPFAQSGCTLFATPDLLDVSLPGNGYLSIDVPFPNTPALVGQSVLHQVVPIELGPQLQFLSMTASNALELTVGAF